MATIRARKQADGAIRYMAIVRLRKGKEVIHQETKTFSQRTAAEKWAKSREVALEDPAALVKAKQTERSLSSLIRWYIDNFSSVSKWQRTKQAQLEYLEKHPTAKANIFNMTSGTLIDHVRSRRAAGAGPATAANDLTWIGVVLRAARSVEAIPINTTIVEEARTACRELRLIGKSKRRDRRPTADELLRLDDYFKRRDGRAQIPMHDILWFAIHSARRQSEICRIEWRDNNAVARTGVVRDAKHPTAKLGNHRSFKYTPEAWDIVKRQPKTSEFIFPYNPRSICDAFTRACHVLGIEDLRFHDLRHEGTSRLFERGYQIHEVAQFTLHDSWNELKRYTNLRAENVREITAPNQSAPGRSGRSRGKASKSATTPSRAVDQSTQRDQPH
jgi:integrase